MPRKVEIRRDRLGAYIAVDGEDLPADWFAEADIHLGTDLTPKVTLTMLPQTVVVVDSLEGEHGQEEGNQAQQS